MDVFKLRNELIQDYERYVNSFINIRDERIFTILNNVTVAGISIMKRNVISLISVRDVMKNCRLLIGICFEWKMFPQGDDKGLILMKKSDSEWVMKLRQVSALQERTDILYAEKLL